MTNRPSYRPGLTRKDAAFREGIGLSHIRLSKRKTVETVRKETVKSAAGQAFVRPQAGPFASAVSAELLNTHPRPRAFSIGPARPPAASSFGRLSTRAANASGKHCAAARIEKPSRKRTGSFGTWEMPIADVLHGRL